MAKTIVTIHEVIELNHMFEEKGLSFKIHLHDACGAQSFSVEGLTEDASKEEYERVNEEIALYFKSKGIEIMFTQNNRDFYVI